MHFSRKNVVVLLKGGLGNQLFQYAAGKSLAIRLGVHLILDLNWYIDNEKDHTKCILEKFNINDQYFKPPSFFPRKFRSALYKLVEKSSTLGLANPVIREVRQNFDQRLLDVDSPVILDGYWQNELYFHQYRKQIIEYFQLKEKMDFQNKKLLNQIKAVNSVCIHIRRGDYVTDLAAANIHGTCSIEYYSNAIELLSSSIEAPHFYIFSDDYEWVKSNITINYKSIFVDHNLMKPEIDFILMKSCKHFIIANSTFSWWAAWLSEYNNKEVYAPINWFASEELTSKDLVPKNWIRL